MRGLSVDEYIKKTGKAYPVREGYFIGACAVCGQRVVKSIRTGQPMHMHRRSKKCRASAKESA